MIQKIDELFKFMAEQLARVVDRKQFLKISLGAAFTTLMGLSLKPSTVFAGSKTVGTEACGPWYCVGYDLFCYCNKSCSGSRSSTQCWRYEERNCGSYYEGRYVLPYACHADVCYNCGDYKGTCGTCSV